MGESCHFCPSQSNIDHHHVDGDGENGSGDNIIPVCRSCHLKIHYGSPGYEEWYEKLPEEKQRDGGRKPVSSDDRLFGAGVSRDGAVTIPHDIRLGLDIEEGDRVQLEIKTVNNVG